MILPALRAVDAFAMEMDGETFVGMRDPEGIVEDQLMLSQPLPFSGERSEEPLTCLIAPHIDLHRGGHSYAWGI